MNGGRDARRPRTTCQGRERSRPLKREKRPYELKRRGERQAATRRRIVRAAVGLHGSVGPLATTISAIARRARVERETVYRHFPDERSLFAACTAHHLAAHPGPSIATWRAIIDPPARLERALHETYAYYAAIGHALRFQTWRSLVRDEELGADGAIRLMVALVRAA